MESLRNSSEQVLVVYPVFSKDIRQSWDFSRNFYIFCEEFLTSIWRCSSEDECHSCYRKLFSICDLPELIKHDQIHGDKEHVKNAICY